MWQKYKAVNNILVKFGNILAGILIGFNIAIIGLEIFLRNLLHTSTEMSDELSGYSLVAILFLGAAQTLQNNGMVRVKILLNRLSKEIKKIIDIPIYILTFVFILILLINLIKFVLVSYQYGQLSGSWLHTPLWIPQSTMVIGLVLILMQLFSEFVDNIIDLKNYFFNANRNEEHE